MHLYGEANDYFGKGLSGAVLSVRPPEGSTFSAEDNIIVGNVAFYGATSGLAFIRGMAGERFCVRNSGVAAVVEGIGDNGCEYMTGGKVVVLGTTGRNFAAGMSGGVAFIYDTIGDFAEFRCNQERVDLEPVIDSDDRQTLQSLIRRHHNVTGSLVAGNILKTWDNAILNFIKVIPAEYKAALERLAEEEKVAQSLS